MTENVVDLPMPKVDEDTADHEFARLAHIWNLDTEIETMEEEDRKGFVDLKRRIVRAIRSGHASVGDDGEVILNLKYSETINLDSITLHVPGGRALLATDNHREQRAMHKMNEVLASMTGQSPATFAKMDGRDYKIAQALVQLFLGS